MKRKLFGSTTATILALVLMSGVVFGAVVYVYHLKVSQTAKTGLRNIPLTVSTLSGDLNNLMPTDTVEVKVEKPADTKAGNAIFKLDYDPTTAKLAKYIKIIETTAPDIMNSNKLKLKNPATGQYEYAVGKTLDQIRGWESQLINTQSATGNNIIITLKYEFLDPLTNLAEVTANPSMTINYLCEYQDY